MTYSNPNYLSKDSFPNITMPSRWGVGIQTYEFWRNTNIQSITNYKLWKEGKNEERKHKLMITKCEIWIILVGRSLIWR